MQKGVGADRRGSAEDRRVIHGIQERKDAMKMMCESDERNYLPTYEGCYVCGQSHPRGLRIRFFTGDFGQVHASFRPDCTQTSYKNVVHGGVISALMDELLGWPIALQTGRMAVTGELTVRFRMPMQDGHTYLATAYPGENRRRYWEGKGDIRDDQGRVCIKAEGKYFLLSAEQTAKVAKDLTYQPGDPPVFHYDSSAKVFLRDMPAVLPP